MKYAELQVTSNFTFLLGASHPEELVEQAIKYGYKAIAITDRNSFAGIVRAHGVAKKSNIDKADDNKIKFISACRLDLLDGPSLLAYPTDTAAYSRLSGLLTTGNLRAEKGECYLYKADVYQFAQGIKFIVIPPAALNEQFDFDESFKTDLKEYRQKLGNHVYLALSRSYHGDDGKRMHRLWQLSNLLDVPLAATNDVYYHEAARRQLQDVLTCVREKCTIHTAGFKLYQNAERHLKPVAEMHRILSQYPGAIENTLQIAAACNFTLDSLKYVYPEEITSDGRTPQQEITHLAWEGAKERYPEGIPEKVKASIIYELNFIEKKNYASYFLTVHDYVRFARSRNILCQGRGSAANSVVCYCLGITSVDPSKFNLLFARFMSDARDEPPDIDVDFEHERREEVIQYIYEKYGRDRSAIVATVTQERHKGAIRDVGKAMGLSVDIINSLSAGVWDYNEKWMNGDGLEEKGLNRNDPVLRKVMELTGQLVGFPRQLGQHTGGFVITQGQLSDLCPIMNARMENRTCVEWNKDDIEALGFLKVDVLGLGMLTCIRKAFELAKKHYDVDLTLAEINKVEDPKVYDMICNADTIGVFQIESRAQMSMLPRLKPSKFYDLVIEVAIVRPGPIQGDMVHPYLRRRDGIDPIIYPTDELKNILERTLGVPLFQEQAMEIAIVAADFTHAEADQLRRSMATFKAKGQVSEFRDKLINGMVKKGYDREFSSRVFRQLEGFGSYGFPESHAASFALLVYVSSWLKCYYPDVFATALLNSLPMGFYQPAQIVIDARKHGVEVRPADINHSEWDNTLEEKTCEYCAIRLGFRQIKGIGEEEMQLLVTNRNGKYQTITQLLDAGIAQTTLEKLADADAFRSIGLDRRQALWEVAALSDTPVALFAGQPSESVTEAQVALPLMAASEHVVEDYATTSLSLKAHPVSFVREQLSMLHVLSTRELDGIADGTPVKVAGLVLVRQRPGTAKGVCFITIEDETGYSNLVVFQNLFEKYKREILQARLLMVEGKLQREGQVVHIIASRCFDLSKMLRGLTQVKTDDLPLLTLARADETTNPFPSGNNIGSVPQNGQKEIFHKGRNFR
ncbi:error-prone DNA polymerase [Mucilaginibacter pallidiroseus]|uniref:Error-prone DNA polymerase n=1 Tax=Mucilaginibacter pallidiroseus TaxID=2599295 RepID=A0A563U0Q1_9SPHI|nr:error-prone DNA polymerase [Mucilaginibacter pallidiroseus]TWR25215.1 error-prone DNA polymerase [Mucilaginibacter pallidiroseus]